jgi:hypothetical protein
VQLEVLVREDEDDPDRQEAINELLAPEPQWQPPQQAQQPQAQWQQQQPQWQPGQQQWQQPPPPPPPQQQQQQQQQQAAQWQPDDGWGGFGDLPDIGSPQQGSAPRSGAGMPQDSVSGPFPDTRQACSRRVSGGTRCILLATLTARWIVMRPEYAPAEYGVCFGLLQDWQSPAPPAGYVDPEVDRYQPQAPAQQQPQQPMGDFAYPEQQTMPDYLTGAQGISCPVCACLPATHACCTHVTRLFQLQP